MLSLAHLKNPKYANENPWDVEARERKEAATANKKAEQERKMKLAKAMGSLDGWTIGSGGNTGLSSADNARGDYFAKQAQARKAHPGGKINSNKIEATYKFLKRKQEKGAELSKEELDMLARLAGEVGGGGEGGEGGEVALEALKKKAEEEKKEREKERRRKGSFGGGANKDCRKFEKSKGGNGNNPIANGGKGKKNSKGKNGANGGGKKNKGNNNKKDKNVHKASKGKNGNNNKFGGGGGKAKSESTEGMLGGALSSGR
ncbi:hypothetical protein TrLO_g641 [Triparma laevis f. longispina]|uniref:Uncharacterized protein n=1 Tax=Triparma laevis f. longispina TaxID=1714387 RepID=A0A9W7FHT1_9STRA|nr:hypothetical protein TrLO_g641 [Triparma laevis f. longispina]